MTSLYKRQFGVLIRDRASEMPVIKEGEQAVSLLKASAVEEERFVLGVVLRPTKELNQPDSQGDIYSAEEVRAACHNYMEKSGKNKVQHQYAADGKMKIIENYIAPVDMVVNGREIAKGTWMMGVRVTDDELWAAVKSGAFTGFSIGGVAKRTRVG